MNAKLVKLSQHRAALVHKIERQRTDLAQEFAPLRGPLAIADKGLRVVSYLRSHPAVLAAGLALAASIRPKGVLGWLQRGLLLWQTAVALKRSLLP